MKPNIRLLLAILGLTLSLQILNGYCWIQHPENEQTRRAGLLARDDLNRKKHVDILKGNKPNFTDDFAGRWFLAYNGRPFGVELILIILLPAWIGLLLGFCLNVCLGRVFRRPIKEELKPRRPIVSIARLQQTKLEQKLGQRSLIGVDWYAKHFVIRANDKYVDIDQIMRDDNENKNAFRRNPWRFIRQFVKVIGWYQEHQKKRNMETEGEDDNAPPTGQGRSGSRKKKGVPLTESEELNQRFARMWEP